MIVNAWNNGAHSRNGSGYGFRVHPADRDEYFKKDWEKILLEIDGEAEPVEVTLPGEDFWSEGGKELSCPALGRWLRKNGMAPWARGNSPVFVLDPIEENRFRVSKARKGGRAQ